MRHRLTAHGSAATDEVWDRYRRPSRWPEWSPQIRSVSYDFDQIRPDTTGTVVGPVGLRVGFEITSVEPAERRWHWTVRVGAIRLALDHRVTDDGTELIIDGPAPVVLGYLPLAQLALQRLVRA